MAEVPLATAVAQLIALTGVEPQHALSLLQQANGNIEVAASEYFFAAEGADSANEGESMTDGSVTDEYEGMDEDGGIEERPEDLAPLPMVRPSPKRPKLEERAAPKLEEPDAAALASIKEVFALAAMPTDAAARLHRMVRDRTDSYAYGDDRGLRYLLGCWSRAKRLDDSSASPALVAFANEAVLHHARVGLLSAAADEDGLSLFGHTEEGEMAALLRTSPAAASPFVVAVNESMNASEQELIYGPAIEALLRKLDPYSGGSPLKVAGSPSGVTGWRQLLEEVEALLGLLGGGTGAPLKLAPHGAAARAVLARRMADEAARLRSGEWSGGEAEGLGVLRLFSTAPAGLPGYRLAKPAPGGGTAHHEDAGVLRAAWEEVWELQTRQRLLLTAAVFKDAEARASALVWIGAVLSANAWAVEPTHAQPGSEATIARARMSASAEATLVNLAIVLLQLCAPFLEPSSERNGKGHDGFARLDSTWFDREAAREAAGRASGTRIYPPAPSEPKLRSDIASIGNDGGDRVGGALDSGAVEGGDSNNRVEDFAEGSEEADELAQAIRLSLLASDGSAGDLSLRGSAVPEGVTDEEGQSLGAKGGSVNAEYHFVTECFFLAMRAVCVGLLPAMRRSERQIHELMRRSRQPPIPPNASSAELSSALESLRAAGLGGKQTQVLAYRCLLDGQQGQALLVRYTSLLCAWLAHVSTQADAMAHFARLPASVLSNACDSLAILARANPERLTAVPEMSPLLSRSLCTLLGRRDLMPSPFVRHSIAELLHTFVQMDEYTARIRSAGRGFGNFLSFTGSLFSLIDLDAATEIQLPLLRLYVELGLHTNEAAVADKNGDRYRIIGVLRALWQQPQAWRAMQQHAKASLNPAAGGEADAALIFGEFAETLVKELVFLLNDALGRLADVHTRQEEMTDEEAWAAQPPGERRKREERLEQVKRTARGFLDLAKASLSALLLLTNDPGTCPAFAAHSERATKLAAMLVEFLRRLVGPEAQSLKVKQPEKLGWNPKQMLTNTSLLLLHAVACVPAFVTTLREADNLDLAVLKKTAHILGTKCNFPPLELDALGRLIARIEGEVAIGATSGTPASTSVTERALADAASIETQAGGATALLEHVNKAYVAELRSFAFDEASMEAPGGSGYLHYYRQNISDAPQEATARSKLRRLVQELSSLSGEGNLPLAAESSVLVLRDEARMDVLKVLISGPADALDPSKETPYAFGLFEFHLFIPPNYPNVPPLVNLQTTGGGMVRFNPNLYSDGKVCLSLLGTWHGEGWTPPSTGNSGSTILQVLVSIQSIIMVPKPYFNEPGYAEEEGTPAGEQRSREYNDDVRLNTLRHAVRDVLRKPPVGFEKAVKAHFRLVKPLLLRQAARWLSEASVSIRAPMERAFTEVQTLLDELDEADERAVESSSSNVA